MPSHTPLCGSIVSIQRGRVVTEGEPGCRVGPNREWTSAFRKTAVAGPVEVTAAGVAGDQFGNPTAHGGVDKAVLFYAVAHYDLWRMEFPSLDWFPSHLEKNQAGGGFGENLTVSEIDETNVCIGDRYSVGSLLVEVSQPRQPCWKINRRWGDPGLLKRTAQTGRTGWYARVINAGTVTAGDSITRVECPHPTWNIARANDLLMGRQSDRMATIELMSLPELADAWKDAIA